MITVGAAEHLTAAFTAANGPYDPAAVTFTVTLPDGTPAAGSPFEGVKDDVGLYHYDYVTTVPGIHQYYPTGTNAGVDAKGTPDVFTVAPLTTAALISLADAKEAINDDTGTGDDLELLLMVRAATEIINGLAGYSLATTVTETLEPTVDRYGRGVIMLSHIPVLTVQSIVGALPGAAAVTVDPDSLDTMSGQYASQSAFHGPQKVTYTAGRAGAAWSLQEACRIVVQWLWETQRGVGTVPLGGEDEIPNQAWYGISDRVLALVNLSGNQKIAGVA